MFADFGFPLLLAQTSDAGAEVVNTLVKSQGMSGWQGLGLAVLILVGAFSLGSLLAQRLRMPDYATKIGFILFTFIAGFVVCAIGEYKFGIDLAGGNVLIYQIQGADMDALVTSVSGQLNASDEQTPLAVHSQGQTLQVEIPDGADVAALKLRIEQACAASLKLQSVKEEKVGEKTVLAYEPSDTFSKVKMDDLVSAINKRLDPGGLKELTIRPRGDQELEIIIPETDSREVDFIKKQISTAGLLQFRILASRSVVEHEKWIKLAEATERDKIYSNGRLQAQWVLCKQGMESPPVGSVTRGAGDKLQVLIMIDDQNVTGDFLESASSGFGEKGPEVLFSFGPEGARRFGALTRANLPDAATGTRRNLSILLDNRLQSAPTIESEISSSGRISGNFSHDEVRLYVSLLDAGRLRASLNPLPIRQETISQQLGKDTIEKGKLAMMVSTGLVLLFMVYYYGFAGLVADIAVCMNMVLAVAMMVLIKAAFTLPGLAGLVLTVGMAVDANVLIYERIREETARGASLRMAIRNGFSKAFTTIIDSNMTTIGTAVVLYLIGTSQIKGFAISLILGLIVSLYTAVFVARVVFDIWEQQRWLKRIRFRQLIGQTHIDFVKWRGPAIALSVVVIALGAVVFGMREKGLNGAPSMWDIDFRGGNSVNAVLASSKDVADVRSTLHEKLPDLAISSVGTAGTEFKIDTSEPDVERVKQTLREAFGDQLQHDSMTFDALSAITPGGSAPKAVDPEVEKPEADKQAPAKKNASIGQPQTLALAALSLGDDPAPAADAKNASDGKAATDDPTTLRTWTTLHFPQRINHANLTDLIEAQAKAAGVDPVIFSLGNEKYESGARNAFQNWTLEINQSEEVTKNLLDAISTKLASEPVFTAANSIGARVGDETKFLALYAMLASMVMIVIYVWFRFHSVMFGVAAVIALIHDVAVAVAFLAFSYYLAGIAGFDTLLVNPFKISLTVVAALLTIVGYSVNDTIVIFDRIREIRGKSPILTEKIVNDAMNQTLSRTILTSGTVLIGATILYFLGGEGIHPFAYTMLIGLISGTYSTIYIATPIVLWLRRADEMPAPAGGAKQPVKLR